jgi:subtilisin family serine protease
MKHKNIVLYFMFLLFIIFSFDIKISNCDDDSTLLIKVDNLNYLKSFESKKGFEIIKIIEEINVIVVRSDEVFSDDVRNELLLDSNILFIEQNIQIGIPENEAFTDNFENGELSMYSDDPFWSFDSSTGFGQWNMRILELEEAWGIESGNNMIVVSVIDTGIAYDHQDIIDNYLPGGYNWAYDNDDPYDDNGHGSWVSGVIAAKKNNQIGIAGIADVKIMAEKVLNSNGGGKIDDLIMGLIHATDLGVDIINLSLGTDSYSQALEDAVNYAYDSGCILVAAAGNRNRDTPHYPAAFENVISVTATYGEPDDVIAPYSNYGEWVDLSAPGGWDADGSYTPDFGEYWILSLSDGKNKYMYGTGTSGSVPHVSGTAALCLSLAPSLNSQEIEAILANSSEDKGTPGWDTRYGHGRINVKQALLNTPVLSVGGEATIIHLISKRQPVRSNMFLIFFIITLFLGSSRIISSETKGIIHKEKIELYKRTKTNNRGK